MSEAIFSPFWYRVAELKPKLRHHVRLHRHEYRGDTWYALQDKLSGRYHRFGERAYQIIGRMNGERTLNTIWDSLNSHLEDDAPSQEEIIELLGKLHSADLLLCDITPDAHEILQREQDRKRSKLQSRLINPLTQRIPLWDPDRFLSRLMPWVRWLFHWTIGIGCVVLIGQAGLQAGLHWAELSHDLLTRSLEPYNLLAICLTYPVVKLLHELGHACAAKIGGGEVHEMGIMFLLLLPVPYVDVSCSTVFESKYQRMLVSSAGIIIELVLASLALFLWIQLEPGFVRDMAFNVLLIGSFSSLFFNGNPLLRYDGYYVLADAVDIPNLYQRANQYIYYLCQRYLFGVGESVSPVIAKGEAGWFLGYSIAALIYRLMLLWVIFWFVVDKAFFVGIALAVWMLIAQVGLPLFKGLRFVLTDSRIEQQRIRALGVSCLLLVSIVIGLFVIPAPSTTSAMGVVSIPEDGQLRVGTDGFLSELLVDAEREVSENAPIILVEDVFLPVNVEILRAQLKEVKTRYNAFRINDRVQAEIVKEEMAKVSADLDYAIEELDATTVRSPKKGNLVMVSPEDQPGRYVTKGELIGYILDDDSVTARVLINQNDIGKVRKGIIDVEVVMPGRMNDVLAAKVLREFPEATNRLPAPALASTHGGPITVDPSQPDQLIALDKYFQIDLEILNEDAFMPIGSKVFVRFYHHREPLAKQWYRTFRQLFLKNFNT